MTQTHEKGRGTAHDTSVEPRMRSSLRGPLLGVLIHQQHPTTAYRLTSLLNRCLPGWQVSRSTVSELLNRLEAEGLISSTSGPRRVYSPTDKAQAALDEWMEKPVSQPPTRDELQAKIASSCPRHAPLLVDALDAYLQECFDRLAENPGEDARVSSWRGLAINLAREHSDEHLHARIIWAKKARQSIKEFDASS